MSLERLNIQGLIGISTLEVVKKEGTTEFKYRIRIPVISSACRKSAENSTNAANSAAFYQVRRVHHTFKRTCLEDLQIQPYH